MPPSGYSAQQTTYLSSFLKSCASELLREAIAEEQTLDEKITQEIDDIGSYVLDGHASGEATRGVLALTRAFYEELAAAKPRSVEAYWAAVDAALVTISGAVLDVHISPELKTRFATRRTAAA